ncbi:MAG: type II/IV secretion system protein [Gammaproteobacteria bacterium]|nr:type II/IV secretion system protein [Gammaproteobacteria bacterium]
MQDEPVQLAIAAGVPWIDGGYWRHFVHDTAQGQVTISLPRLPPVAVLAQRRAMQHQPETQLFVMTDAQHLDALSLAAFAQNAETPQRQPPPVDQSVDDAPLVRYVRHLLLESVRLNASDVHFTPEPDQLSIWFRVDGQLRRQDPPPASLTGRLLARLKVMANLDLTESGQPQDGAIVVNPNSDSAHRFRVSIVPALYGEKAVLRRIEHADQVPSLANLGLTPAQQALMRSALAEPSGLIVLTGPTGSGKTQTLSRLMLDLVRDDRHVIAIEDPIERLLPGIQQIQVNPARGFGFANGLRALLRQDPDVLMIGEIRDQDTAQIAIQAAHTGHLVLSTLHTRHVDDVTDRLQQLGVSQHLVTDCLLLTGAQRLAKRLCALCDGGGCGACRHGFLGRVGVFDLLSRTGQRLNFRHAMTHLCAQRLTTEGALRHVLDSIHLEDSAHAMDTAQQTTATDAPADVSDTAREWTHPHRQPDSPRAVASWRIRHTHSALCHRASARCTARRSGRTRKMASDTGSTSRTRHR